MRKVTCVLGGLALFWLLMLSSTSCSRTCYPAFSEEETNGSFECPNEFPTTYMISYDTVISSTGDTLLFKKPYKPSRLEKIGMVVTAAFIYWCIRDGDDGRD